MRYNHFDMLPERAFLKVGGRITLEGGGGGGPSSTQTTGTTYQTNIPEYAQPYVTTMLNATQQQLFNMQDGQITGFNPYRAYGGTYDAQGNQLSYDPSKAVAGFSPLQTRAQTAATGLTTPGQFAPATDLATASGYGSLGAAGTAAGLSGTALGYGASGAGYGAAGSTYGAAGAEAASAAARAAQARAARYGEQGAMYGATAARAAERGFGAGEEYARMATDPTSTAAYMSPYMQNVVDYQKTQALRDYGIGRGMRRAAATGAGAFGGSRQAIAEAEAERSLMSQLGGIEAQGAQQAFQNAQQAQQFGANLGLQGLQAGYAGLGQGISGAQTGLSGVGQQIAAGNLGLAGTAQGIQGAQAGMQGAGVGLTGLQGAIAAGQYGLQGLGQAGTAAGQLGSLGTQQLAAQQGVIQTQAQQGATQQALQQQIINQAIQDYANAQQYPLMQLGTMSNMLRGLPMQAASTQQYVAQANPTTQAIGTIGSLGSLYGAFGGYGGQSAPARAKGGILSAKKYAKGGIASYDIGGAVEADLYDMPMERLQKELQSPSAEIRKKAKRIMAEKSIEGKAGGGIIAFARSTEENNQSLVEEPEKEKTAEDVQYAPGIKGGKPVAPAPAPAPAPEKPIDVSPAGMKRLLAQGIQQQLAIANRPLSEAVAEEKAMMGPNVAAQKYRESVMAERANADDEFRRQNWLRAAQIFADWGSQPGNTLVAGMNALKGRIGDVISDRQEQKKYFRDIDRTMYELDKADRLEEAGYIKAARETREKAGQNAYHMFSPLSSIVSHEISAGATIQAAAQRGAGAGAADKALDRWTDNLRQATDQLKKVKEDAVKADPSLIMDLSKMPEGEGKRLLAQKQAEWRDTVQKAQNNYDVAKREVDALKKDATTGGGSKGEGAPAPADKITVDGKEIARPAGFSDAQWAEYKKYAGAK